MDQSMHFLQSAHPVGVAAQPPSAVSLSSNGRDWPTLYMASTISSNGIGWHTPASASWALVKALDTPMALRLWQGLSTRPAIGSQTRPSRLERARDAAVRHAVAMAESGDIVLFAGKGHETYQLICGEKVPFVERDIIRDACRTVELKSLI